MPRGIYIHKPHSQETKDNIGKPQKGIPRPYARDNPQVFKKGRVPWNIGLRYNNPLLSGENHYRWIKDRSFAEKNQRNDAGYSQWVIKVKKRDKGQCRLKNKDCSGYNIVHHILDWSNYPELRYKINNGIALCHTHHPRGRVKEKRLVPILEELVSVSS